MNDVSAALIKATQLLERTSETARLDAELLMAHALKIDRSTLLLRIRDFAVPPEFDALIARRAAHEPVAYIRGLQEFWDIVLRVTPDTLIPRADSETLIEAAQRRFRDTAPPAQILDLGTGSGALLLAALSLFPDAHGLGIDASSAALAVARENADTLGFANRCRFAQASWCDNDWASALGRFDLILCNPPYIESDAALMPSVQQYEPPSALFAGTDGLDDYRRITPHIPALLSPSGIALFEIGMGQAEAVGAIAAAVGLSATAHPDLAGIPRAVEMRVTGA
jgi:release factor glutamine methyltransferase